LSTIGDGFLLVVKGKRIREVKEKREREERANKVSDL
jgi:hypothetical protein